MHIQIAADDELSGISRADLLFEYLFCRDVELDTPAEVIEERNFGGIRFQVGRPRCDG
jgi:hypothetical protein